MTREEAIKIFNEVLLFGKAPCTQAEFEELAKMSIQALEQEPKTGHWVRGIEVTERHIYIPYVKCSECGIGMGNKRFDYCPNCGAKMIEQGEKDD